MRTPVFPSFDSCNPHAKPWPLRPCSLALASYLATGHGAPPCASSALIEASPPSLDLFRTVRFRSDG
jgi:hypothetical protein